jgi:hypothetical protein
MIKLSVAFKKAVSAIAFKKAVAAVTFQKAVAAINFQKAVASVALRKAVAKIEFGVFLIFKFITDNIGTTETVSKAISKTLSDSQDITDNVSTNVQKIRTDTFAATDSVSTEAGKVLSDSGSLADSIDTFAIGKGLSEYPILSESRSTDFHKIINEAFYATDDLDGEATAQDDQEMTFVKVRTDLTGVTDVISILLNQVRLLADSSTVSDSGSLRSQGYVSFDYMAEDFVGASRTF